MNLGKEIKTLKSAYKGNSDALAAINATQHIFVTTVTEAIEQHQRAHANRARRSPALSLVASIIGGYPGPFQSHLQKAVDDAANAINDCIISASLDAAQQLPDDPKAQDLPDALRDLVAQQLDQLQPHITGEAASLESDLFTINTLMLHELRTSTPAKVLKAIKYLNK